MKPKDIILDYIRAKRVNPLVYWLVEDTGYSGGVSWFSVPLRFVTESKAFERAQRIKQEQDFSRVRVVQVTTHRTYDDDTDDLLEEKTEKTFKYL